MNYILRVRGSPSFIYEKIVNHFRVPLRFLNDSSSVCLKTCLYHVYRHACIMSTDMFTTYLFIPYLKKTYTILEDYVRKLVYSKFEVIFRPSLKYVFTKFECTFYLHHVWGHFKNGCIHICGILKDKFKLCLKICSHND